MRLSSVLHKGSRSNEVRQVQELLNLAHAQPRLQTDGDFGDATYRAVRYFQSSRPGLSVDGRVGQRTLDELERVTRTNGTTLVTPPTTTSGTGEFCFPLAHRPSPDWKGGGRYFGAPRSHGRLHAACDLLAPYGTTIYAIADGTLVRDEYYFYEGTNAVEVRHGSFLVRYGEIKQGSYIGGRTVRKGEPICKVGRLNSGSSMLHFELYSNGASSASLSSDRGPYKRRSDVINASAYLDQWAHNLPGG